MLDDSGSVKKLGRFVKDAKTLVAYKRLNDAFVFYHEKPIPIFSNAAEVQEFAKTHPDVLVLQLGKNPDLTDSVPELRLVHDEKDLFSSQHSYIYLKK